MSVLSREVITEWAARGQRGKRRQSRSDELRAHAEIGEPIKAELIALTAPLVEFIQKHGLAGVSIPMQDSAEAKDIHVDCFPLYEEIECVLDKWGSIYIEVDAATNRQRIADSHESQRQRITELEAANAEICKRAKVWQDEVDRLEAEREHAVRVMGDTVKQHATQGESLAAALKELNEARNMCPFSFNDLPCCLTRGHQGRHCDRQHISAVAWTTEQSTTKELASLRLRVQDGEANEFGIRLSGCETPITVLPEHVARQMVAAMPNTYFLQSRAPAGPWVAAMASKEGK